jgi:hypothetical protein
LDSKPRAGAFPGLAGFFFGKNGDENALLFRFLESSDDPGVFGFPEDGNPLTGKVDLASASDVFRDRDCKLVFTMDEGKLCIIRDDEKGDCGVSEDLKEVTGTYVRKRPGLAAVGRGAEP